MNFDQFLLNAITNKETVIASLLKDMQDCTRKQEAIHGAMDTVIDNPAEENLRKMLRSTMSLVGEQAILINKLLTVSLVYVSSDSFSKDSASVAVKLGRGEEAIKAFAKAKFGGMVNKFK
jgi:hypothetical protein